MVLAATDALHMERKEGAAMASMPSGNGLL